jgi:hypothetical protein
MPMIAEADLLQAVTNKVTAIAMILANDRSFLVFMLKGLRRISPSIILND